MPDTASPPVARSPALQGWGACHGASYGDLNEAFHVGRFSDIPDARWEEVMAWFKQQIEAAEKRQRRYP
jgi:hypothetical protein